jgi:hypothetical protein
LQALSLADEEISENDGHSSVFSGPEWDSHDD